MSNEARVEDGFAGKEFISYKTVIATRCSWNPNVKS
jgi:hypothetical protein